MKTQEILQVLPDLSLEDRLTIVEAALRLINQEKKLSRTEQKRQLQAAAMMAVSDYAPESTLLVFSELDGEDFHDYSEGELK